MLYLLTLPILLAGGEIAEGIEEACDAGESASACLALAEDSQCGVGFNSSTAAYIQQARNINKNRCAAGIPQDCMEEILWTVGATFVNDDNEKMLDAFYELSYLGGILYNPEFIGHGQEISFNNKELSFKELFPKSLDKMQTGCNKGHADSCLLAAEILRLKSKHDNAATPKEIHNYWKQACELNHPEGCAQLSLFLAREAESLSDKACKLGKAEQYQYRFTTKYKDLCKPEKSSP